MSINQLIQQARNQIAGVVPRFTDVIEQGHYQEGYKDGLFKAGRDKDRNDYYNNGYDKGKSDRAYGKELTSTAIRKGNIYKYLRGGQAKRMF